LREGGLDESRVTLSPPLDTDRYFEALAGTDVALDTQPYNGATTTLDALWSGTPVVALAGDRSVSRSGVSILRAAGLAELIAGSSDEYVAINLRLARDERWRSQLRAILRDRLVASPLMDAATFTRDVEALYRQICRVATG
jgi:protein O-GlcNAc transferase